MSGIRDELLLLGIALRDWLHGVLGGENNNQENEQETHDSDHGGDQQHRKNGIEIHGGVDQPDCRCGISGGVRLYAELEILVPARCFPAVGKLCGNDRELVLRVISRRVLPDFQYASRLIQKEKTAVRVDAQTVAEACEAVVHSAGRRLLRGFGRFIVRRLRGLEGLVCHDAVKSLVKLAVCLEEEDTVDCGQHQQDHHKEGSGSYRYKFSL